MIDSQYHKNYYKDRILALQQYLGGKCVICGSTENLEFDHTDRTTKRFNIAKIAKRKWSFVVAELDKCELLCKDCHKRKSSAELKEQYAEQGSKFSKAIDQVDMATGQVVHTYASMHEAMRAGFKISSISDCCNGKQAYHRGFIWRYHA